MVRVFSFVCRGTLPQRLCPDRWVRCHGSDRLSRRSLETTMTTTITTTTTNTYRRFVSSKVPLMPTPDQSEKEPPTTTTTTTTTPHKETSKVVFPWRHEELPLPRLVEGTEEHTLQGPLLYSVTNQTGDLRMNMLATAFMFLDVPLYQFLFFSSWKGELADNMSWAFTQGVAGLLSNLTSKAPTRISETTIIQENYELCFHATVGGTKDEAGAGTTHKEDDAKKKAKDHKEEGSRLPLQNMLDQKMIDLYNAAKDNIVKETEICLKTYPHTAELVNLYAIPYISRENVKHDKELLSFYRDLMSKSAMDRNPGLTKLRKEKLEAGIMESTVIAQVLVWCNEVFYVKDVESGKIIQGTDQYETARNVCHLLRMESRVKTTRDPQQGSYKNIHGDWIITDIDDMLGGNLIV